MTFSGSVCRHSSCLIKPRRLADWKSAERVFAQPIAVVDRFGELHGVLARNGGVTVNVDRSSRVLNVVRSLSEERIRELLADPAALAEAERQLLAAAEFPVIEGKWYNLKPMVV